MEKLRAVGKWVLLKIIKEKKSKGGVIIPTQAQGKTKFSTLTAEILDIGPDAFGDGEDCISLGQIKVGDKVKVFKSLLIELEEEYFMIKPSGVVGKLPKEEE